MRSQELYKAASRDAGRSRQRGDPRDRGRLASRNDPLQTAAYLSRDHGAPPPSVARATGYTADQRAAAAWLLPKLAPEDRIVATDWLSTYYYTRKVDAWIRSENYARKSVLRSGKPHEVYLDAEVLPTLEDIKSYAEAGPIWIVAGGAELTSPRFKVDRRSWTGSWPRSRASWRATE